MPIFWHWKSNWQGEKPCHLRGSNTGPSDLQSDALPAELKRLQLQAIRLYYNKNEIKQLLPSKMHSCELVLNWSSYKLVSEHHASCPICYHLFQICVRSVNQMINKTPKKIKNWFILNKLGFLLQKILIYHKKIWNTEHTFTIRIWRVKNNLTHKLNLDCTVRCNKFIWGERNHFKSLFIHLQSILVHK